jgi:hypothetical protein
MRSNGGGGGGAGMLASDIENFSVRKRDQNSQTTTFSPFTRTHNFVGDFQRELNPEL